MESNIEVKQIDITELDVDAIVNAANSQLLEGGGVCGAIFHEAGSMELTDACSEIGSCETGDAVITPGFGLPAKYIIHAVGPIWQGGDDTEAELLYNTYINTVVVYGGEKTFPQKYELQEGCDIVIGTPGRLIQFLEEGIISLSQVKFLVIDEADELLDMGFGEDINHILYDFKWSEYYNIFLMSATFPKKVLNMVESLMKNEKYSFITHGNYLGEKEDANGNVKQRFYLIESGYNTNIFDKKIDALFGLLKLLDGKTLIFANKKDDVMEIAYRVEEYGYGIVGLIGDMDMNQRIISLNEFKNGNVNLMVASDVASRGLDIPEVSYVINFDMPQNIDIYVHRIGRTGRVGNQGNSLTLLTREDQSLFRPLFELLSKSNQKIPDFLNSRF